MASWASERKSSFYREVDFKINFYKKKAKAYDCIKKIHYKLLLNQYTIQYFTNHAAADSWTAVNLKCTENMRNTLISVRTIN